MKEMSLEDKERIEEAQDQAAKEWNSAFDYRALRNGVQVGNIKMHYLDEVNKRAMEIYGERMAELLKEERNKAIDELVKLVFEEDGDFNQHESPASVMAKIQALKDKQ